MPAPLTDAKQQEILDLHAQGVTRNDIARRAQVSPSTVTKICTLAGVTFDRTKTKSATEAKQVDAKAIRTDLSTGSIQAAKRVLDRINGMLDEHAELTMKDAATVLGILADKHIALSRVDSADKDLPAVDAWLAHMMGEK